MTRTELFTGLEEARQQFNQFQGDAKIYIDFDDMTAWCMTFDLPRYHSNNIITLVWKSGLNERNDRYGKERLNMLSNAKLDKFKRGWTKTELEDGYNFAEFLSI